MHGWLAGWPHGCTDRDSRHEALPEQKYRRGKTWTANRNKELFSLDVL